MLIHLTRALQGLTNTTVASKRADKGNLNTTYILGLLIKRTSAILATFPLNVPVLETKRELDSFMPVNKLLRINLLR